MSLVLLVAVAFAPCLGNGFVTWDDEANYLGNPFYRGLDWPRIAWAWTTSGSATTSQWPG